MYPTQVVINLVGGTAVRGILADYHEIDGGVEKPVGRRRIQASDVETVLPTTAQFLAQLAELQEQVATITKERDDALKAKEAADAEAVAARAERAATADQAAAYREDAETRLAQAASDAGKLREDLAAAVMAHNEAMGFAAGQKTALEAQLAERDAQAVERERQIAALQAQVDALTAAPPVVKTYTSDLWRRATDAEGGVLEAIIAALPAKQRGLINSITYLDHADEQFPAIEAALAEAFGADRAAEMLAPSA